MGAMIISELQAKRLTQKIFSDDKLVVSMREAMNGLQIQANTYYNYAAILKRYGFAKNVPSKTGERAQDLQLTTEGMAVLREKLPKALRGRQPGHSPTKSMNVTSPEALQKMVDSYNAANPSWPYELVPKGYIRKEEVISK